LQICYKEEEKNTALDLVTKKHNGFSFSQTIDELIKICQKDNKTRAGGKEGKET